MDRKEITNSQDYKATKVALEWWYSLSEEQRKATDIDAEPDIVDAYTEGVIYGWNNPQWIPVEERLPEIPKNDWKSNNVLFVVNGEIFYGYHGKYTWHTPFVSFNNHEVTHWMLLPPLPRKEE